MYGVVDIGSNTNTRQDWLTTSMKPECSRKRA